MPARGAFGATILGRHPPRAAVGELGDWSDRLWPHPTPGLSGDSTGGPGSRSVVRQPSSRLVHTPGDAAGGNCSCALGRLAGAPCCAHHFPSSSLPRIAANGIRPLSPCRQRKSLAEHPSFSSLTLDHSIGHADAREPTSGLENRLPLLQLRLIIVVVHEVAQWCKMPANRH